LLWSLTRSGYANTYYASAVYAGSHSWSAMFFNAVDLSQYVSIDKTPLAVWMMSLSARIFGFSSFSMLLPNALCGVASVLVLHNIVRRTLGHRAAILAALMLALTPVAVLVGRFNNPDALLVLLLICSAWAVTRAIESGRTRHLLLCGLLVGLAFNTKMLQAYLVLPALGLAFLVAGPGRVRRRLAQLAAGGAATFAVSFAWVAAVMLVPAGDRPFVGDTTSNSWWDLIFNANGLDRTATGSTGGGPGGGPGGGFGGGTGLLRTFNEQIGGQIAWLMPLAAVGLIVGLWLHRRGPRTDRARAAYLLWGGWALVHAGVFSLFLSLLHPYYMSALAPAVAVLAAGGLVALWDRSRESRVAAAVLAASLLATGALSFALLDRTPDFVPWLRWVVLALAITGSGAVLARLLARAPAARLAPLVIGAGLAVMLAGPTAYSIATVGQALGGGDPKAGPSSAGGGAPGGFGPPGRAIARAGAPGGLPLPQGSAARRGPGGPAGGERVDKQLIGYLKAHRGGAKYLVAANGSHTAAPIILATHQPVITMGGFMGGDPSPGVTQLRKLIASGQLRYVLLGGGPGSGGPGGGPPGGAPPGGGPPPGGTPPGGGPGGPPGAGPGGRGAGAQARQKWVTTHCTAVSYAGASASATGQGLYDCSSAK
ncbi:MAG: hypothetical protein QOD76_640, partial [Solirubrobacteraceae bacterium]|nr:hypothetical protein [Solirubrobacteraceae bacterium]